MADRRDLQEGIQKARPWILPKVTEVTKVTGNKISRVQMKKKRRKGGESRTREFHRNQR